MGIYYIHEARFEEFFKKMETLSKKCAKVGAKLQYKIEGTEFHYDYTKEGIRYGVKYYVVNAEGKAAIKGWDLVGVIEYVNGQNLVKQIDDSVEIPEEYYTKSNTCDYCHCNRARVKNCILYNKQTGEFKQVGTSCLKMFTGVEDVSRYLKVLDAIKAIPVFEYCEDIPTQLRRYPLKEIIAYAVECVKHFGYTSTRDYRSTSDRVKDYYFVKELHMSPLTSYKDIDNELSSCNFNGLSQENLKKAEDIIEFVRNNLDDKSNYYHNLKVLFSDDCIRLKDFGFVVSSVTCYNKLVGDRDSFKAGRDHNEAKSEYVGNVGDKISIDVIDFACVHSMETSFGTYRIYKFKDDKGNLYVWKTTSFVPNCKGVHTVEGIVKEHSEYRGIKETILTRCKIDKPEKSHIDDSTNSVDEAMNVFMEYVNS